MSDQQRHLMTVDIARSTRGASRDRKTSTLPPAMLKQIAGRLQLLGGVGMVLILIGWIGVNLVEGELAGEFQTTVRIPRPCRPCWPASSGKLR